MCQDCKEKPARPKEKFCSECRKKVLAALAEAGHLTPRPFTPYRGADKRENVHETKFGDGH